MENSDVLQINMLEIEENGKFNQTRLCEWLLMQYMNVDSLIKIMCSMKNT